MISLSNSKVPFLPERYYVMFGYLLRLPSSWYGGAVPPPLISALSVSLSEIVSARKFAFRMEVNINRPTTTAEKSCRIHGLRRYSAAPHISGPGHVRVSDLEFLVPS